MGYLNKAFSDKLHRRDSPPASESGFTLIELLIVLVIVPLIVGALSMGLYSVLTLQASTTARISDTGDSQVVGANFTSDVQAAMYLTTMPTSAPQCGTGNQLLGLEWNLNTTTGNYQTAVSYVSEPITSGGATTYSLVRHYCTNGNYASPSDTTISYDLPSAQAAPTVACVASCDATSSWVSTQNVTSVVFPVVEPQSNYSYTLEAVPADSATTSSSGQPISTGATTTCGFATPGTGTYASTLCFVDFSLLNTAANMTAATNGGLEVSVALPEHYTLYFNLALSGAPVNAVAFPTYPEAFLGNSIGGTPFYIGVPGSPALYQPNSNTTTTVSITQITVVNPQGVAATGWEAVGADAETTDPNETISWTSDQNLNLLPNTPTSPEGDACNAPSPSNPANPGPGGTELTGLGTTSVTCTSTWQATVPRTGTTMLWAATPSSLVTTLKGAGLEGVSFGLLLS
jgi:prepilin-type N-terminal cleavage/methylation domain-containing protein